MKRKVQFVVSSAMLIVAFISFSGCGETIRGVGRDAARIGHGVKTVFISE